MNSLKGHLLIATPQLLDPNFFRTVLLLLDHNATGAMGVILNRPTEATVTEVAERILLERFDWDKPIHLGGPVAGPLLVLHTDADHADQEVLDGVVTTFDASKVEQLIQSKPEPSLIVANYAGWGPGQLESELNEDSWFSFPATIDLVFWSKSENHWKSLIKTVRSHQISNILGLHVLPQDPSQN